MAIHLIELRGSIQGRTPEDYLKRDWSSDVPKTDRFGVHSLSIYEFITPLSPLAVANADILQGVFEVPATEVWEIFSIEQWLQAQSTSGIYNNIQVGYTPLVARWSVSGNNQWLQDAEPDVLLTRPATFSGTTEWETRDEASETIAEAGLRRRILYPKTKLVARMAHGASVTIDAWRVRIDAVRYPSNTELLRRLEANELTRNEFLAGIALRFPSPAEAF